MTRYILLCILYFGGLPLYHSHHLCMLVGYLAHYFFIARFDKFLLKFFTTVIIIKKYHQRWR